MKSYYKTVTNFFAKKKYQHLFIVKMLRFLIADIYYT